MSEQTKGKSISSVWYLLGGLAVGAVAGILFAPKKGSETREDLEALGRQGREKADALIARMRRAVPSRIKAAAAYGAVKGAGAEVLNSTREKAEEFIG